MAHWQLGCPTYSSRSRTATRDSLHLWVGLHDSVPLDWPGRLGGPRCVTYLRLAAMLQHHHNTTSKVERVNGVLADVLRSFALTAATTGLTRTSRFESCRVRHQRLGGGVRVGLHAVLRQPRSASSTSTLRPPLSTLRPPPIRRHQLVQARPPRI